VTDWNKMRDSLIFGTINKSKKEMPRVSCGKCENFRQNSVSAAGDGLCSVQKEGEANMVVFDNTDAGECPHFAEITRIRTNTSEFMWDVHFRPQRQLNEK
jgi:hypothetical protein